MRIGANCSIDVAAATALTPRSIPNLVGWWNARAGNYALSGSDIVTVADLSGNGFTLAPSASKPTLAAAALNGKDAFRFTLASSQYLFNDSVAAPFSGVSLPLTWFVVCYPLDTTGSRDILALNNSGSATRLHRLTHAAALTTAIFNDAGGTWSNATSPAITTAPHIITEWWDGGVSNTDRCWLDSVARTGDPQTVTATGQVTLNRFTIGAGRTPTVARYFDGYVSEVLLYSRALTTDEILRNETFLRVNNGF